MFIIYIHGFGSNGEGSKASLFREYAKSHKYHFIAPSLPYIPDLAIRTLQELADSYSALGHKVCFVGSSLGGFYSTYLASKYKTKAALINPAVQPYETLSHKIEQGESYYDGSTFEWNSGHIESLYAYQVQAIDPKRFMLLIQKGDEVLDYSYATQKFADALQIVEEGGNHSFVEIERYFEQICSFLKS